MFLGHVTPAAQKQPSVVLAQIYLDAVCLVLTYLSV